MVYFKFTWKLNNFSYFWNTLSRVKFYSPEFLITTIAKSKWRILITDEKPGELSYRQIPRNTKFIKIYLASIEDNGFVSLHLHTEVELLQVDGNLLRPHKLGISQLHFKGTNACILHEIIKFDQSIAEILPKDFLIIRCKIYCTSTSSLEKGQCFVKTRLSVEKMHFVATLKKISNLKPGDKILAQIQYISVQKVLVAAVLFLSDKKLYLILKGRNLTHLGYCRVLILDSSNKWEECGRYSNWGDKGIYCLIPLTLNFNTIVDNGMQHYLRDDLMTLKCEVTWYSTTVAPERIDELKYKNVSKMKTETKKSPRTLKTDLLQLQQEGTFCDVKLRAESQTFQAHKAVLSSRSAVFKKMFTSDMKDREIGFVDISDINADTLRSLLKFIYTDSIGSMEWQGALELYFTADKYQIDSLKHKCSIFLKFNIQPTNCCDLLLLSDMHQDSNLKQFAEEYIVRWHKSVLGSDEWRTFKENHIQLAADIICIIFASKWY